MIDERALYDEIVKEGQRRKEKRYWREGLGEGDTKGRLRAFA